MSLLQNKLAVVGLGAVAAALAAFLAFGVFGIQTLFTDTVVDEGGPVFAGGDSEVEEAEDRFTVEVGVGGEVWGRGVGRTKRAAERAAAARALERAEGLEAADD